jgi:hypothetical protein
MQRILLGKRISQYEIMIGGALAGLPSNLRGKLLWVNILEQTDLEVRQMLS